MTSLPGGKRRNSKIYSINQVIKLYLSNDSEIELSALDFLDDMDVKKYISDIKEVLGDKNDPPTQSKT